MRTSDLTAPVLLVAMMVLVWLGGPRLAREQSTQPSPKWTLGVLPASVRIDPVTGRLLESLPEGTRADPLWEKNWLYDGQTVKLAAARGQYVSFQIVVGRVGDEPLRDVVVEMPPLRKGDQCPDALTRPDAANRRDRPATFAVHREGVSDVPPRS